MLPQRARDITLTSTSCVLPAITITIKSGRSGSSSLPGTYTLLSILDGLKFSPMSSLTGIADAKTPLLLLLPGARELSFRITAAAREALQ